MVPGIRQVSWHLVWDLLSRLAISVVGFFGANTDMQANDYFNINYTFYMLFI